MGYSREIVFDKTSGETLDYTVEWKNWLGDDTIASDAWAVDTGITIDETAGGVSSLRTVWLSGGTAGTTYKVTNTVTTTDGRVAARSFYINLVTAR